MDIGIREASATSTVMEALKTDGADRVRRAAAWFPGSKAFLDAADVERSFRCCVRGDWAKHKAETDAARKADAEARQAVRRYVGGPSAPKPAPEDMPTPGELAARSAAQRPTEAEISGPCQADLDAIHAAMSTCAQERLHREALDKAAENAPRFLRDDLRRLPVGTPNDARGGAARLLVAQRNLILRERAANPIVVNGKTYYDQADAQAAKIDLDFG